MLGSRSSNHAPPKVSPSLSHEPRVLQGGVVGRTASAVSRQVCANQQGVDAFPIQDDSSVDCGGLGRLDADDELLAHPDTGDPLRLEVPWNPAQLSSEVIFSLLTLDSCGSNTSVWGRSLRTSCKF